jgi:hypothetical protein
LFDLTAVADVRSGFDLTGRNCMSMDDEPTITPRIGDDVGDVMEADVPGCYHLIVSKTPNQSPRGFGVMFEPFPSWKMVDGELRPMGQEEAMEAFRNRPL